MFKSTIATAKSFQGDEKGNVALMFGLSIVAVMMMAGVGFDFGRAASAKAKVNAAADAAALAAVKGMRLEGLSDAAAITLAKKVFAENMRNGSGNWTDVNSINVTLDRNNSKAVVAVNSSVKTTFAAISGIRTLPASASATAIFEARDVEVSLQLDLTGSMCRVNEAPCTDHPKIQGLKDATKDLVDILLPANRGPQTIRIAFAPFTAGVNLGAYQAAVTDGRTTTDKCVYERINSANQSTELAPIANDAYMIRPDLQAAPFHVSNPRGCPNAPVVPLTDNSTLLKDTVDGYVADGFTAGHNGTAWAWNLISPNFADVWPSDRAPALYNEELTQKVAILMTDGEYNTKNGKNGNGSTIAIETCTAMKTAGIRVYTVGFALDVQAAIDTLAACASNPLDFYRAATPAELRGAFRSIANNIVRMRLTN